METGMKSNRHPIPAARLLLASLLWLFPALTRAEIAVEAWVQRYTGPAHRS
jgi:hypothetical protein